MAKRIGLDAGDRDPGVIAVPVKGQQSANGRGALTSFAEGGEIVFAHHEVRSLVHLIEVERAGVDQRVTPA